MIIVASAAKLHAFNLAEQLEKHQLLHTFYTTYAYQKNIFWRQFVSRVDKEKIPTKKIKTIIPFAIGRKLYDRPYLWNNLFDKWVARELRQTTNYEIFIGWSGNALQSIIEAKKQGKVTILERGSAHILTQDFLLQEEFKKFNIDFHINPKVIEQELLEYEKTDFISIPSTFVKQSFLDRGFPERKLLINPYGTNFQTLLKPGETTETRSRPRVVYLGNLSHQKGIIYLLKALDDLEQKGERLEAWFIGGITPEIEPLITKYKRDHWRFWGHINHYELPKYLHQCDLAVMPSIQDGFGMVIPQFLACGVPVIASENTGGPDIIKNGYNGFIVPIRSTEALIDKITWAINHPQALKDMSLHAKGSVGKTFTWDNYGERYSKHVYDVHANKL